MTQGAGSPDGVSITGMFPDGKAYQARYSTDAIIDTNTLFANLCASMSTSGLGYSETEYLPALGYSSLGTTVYMMEAEYDFVLSAGDQASGTSAFVIVPEPATLSIFVLGCLAFRRRRHAC